jgi:hypothetical protein
VLCTGVIYLCVSLLNHRLLLRLFECWTLKCRCDLLHIHIRTQIVVYVTKKHALEFEQLFINFSTSRFVAASLCNDGYVSEGHVKYNAMIYKCNSNALTYLRLIEIVFVNVTGKY